MNEVWLSTSCGSPKSSEQIKLQTALGPSNPTVLDLALSHLRGDRLLVLNENARGSADPMGSLRLIANFCADLLGVVRRAHGHK